MKNLVLRSAFSLAVAFAGEAHAQAVFNTPDGPVMFRPHIGRARPAPEIEAAPAVVPVAAAARPSRQTARPPAPVGPGQYGGGFIELLMTGRDPGPGIRPVPGDRHRLAALPDWRPPAAMLKRRPDLPRHMAGGPDNPMGARALYLGSSLYRIHGTNEPWTIGEAVSSGCIRMMNEDVIDLYERTRVGAKVLVI